MEDPALQPTTNPEIPDKLYFRIGEVAKIAGIKPYVLRFWESEFPSLGPKKSGTGHRLFRRKDVELVLEIKRLLYDKRFTIEGARKALDTKPKPAASAASRSDVATRLQGDLFASANNAALAEVKRELTEILKLISKES